MQKKIYLLLLIIILSSLFLITGCNKEEKENNKVKNETSDKEETQEIEKINLTISNFYNYIAKNNNVELFNDFDLELVNELSNNRYSKEEIINLMDSDITAVDINETYQINNEEDVNKYLKEFYLTMNELKDFKNGHDDYLIYNVRGMFNKEDESEEFSDIVFLKKR